MFEYFRRRRLRNRLLEARLARAQGRKDEAGLLAALMSLESTRLEHQGKIDAARNELELRRTQWEVENAEAVQRAKEADANLREQIRERRRATAAANRETKRLKIEAAKTEASKHNGGECRVCKGGALDLTVDEITWHYNSHNYGASLIPNGG